MPFYDKISIENLQGSTVRSLNLLDNSNCVDKKTREKPQNRYRNMEMRFILQTHTPEV